MTLIVFALNQLADRLEAEGKESFNRSRRLREEHHDEESDTFTGDEDANYELGYAEARSSSLQEAATRVCEAVKAIEATK